MSSSALHNWICVAHSSLSGVAAFHTQSLLWQPLTVKVYYFGALIVFYTYVVAFIYFNNLLFTALPQSAVES